jgi:phosphoglycerate kinase
MATKSIKDVDLSGKRVFVRCDFNVPLTDGVISDDSRIVAALPTIQNLVAQGAKVILASHLGRPKGEKNAKYTLAPVAEALAAQLGQPVTFIEDCIGEEVEVEVAKLGDGEVALLENVRFYQGETDNDPAFAAQLAKRTCIHCGSCKVSFTVRLWPSHREGTRLPRRQNQQP